MNKIEELEQLLKAQREDVLALEAAICALTDRYMIWGEAHVYVQLTEANADKRLLISDIDRTLDKLAEAREDEEANRPTLSSSERAYEYWKAQRQGDKT